MLSFDGTGYGSSCSWNYEAKQVATDTKELCACWDKTAKHVEIIYDPLKYKNVNLKVFCASFGCNQGFDESSAVLTKKFMEFYQL